MQAVSSSVYAFVAIVAALMGGSASAFLALSRHARFLRQRNLHIRSSGTPTGTHQLSEGLAKGILNRLVLFDRTQEYVAHSEQKLGLSDASSVQKQLVRAGVGNVSIQTVRRFRMRLALIGAIGGALLGSTFGTLAATIASLIGAGGGFGIVSWALRDQAAKRKVQLERHVSQAMEVLCLGLRSGLSFERSLELYCQNFPSQLSRELQTAQQTWNAGLLPREAALRNLSATYDSVVFERVVDHIVRSLRFGSPLADGLEEQAVEARRSHHARVQEMVMKAPVKMMLPIGTLILPSMLLLVMGPILLDLAGGF